MPRIDLDRVVSRLNQRRTFQERDFFTEADDKQLKELTDDAFPAVIKTTHPVFVLAVGSIGVIACPCTRRPREPKLYRSISRGCVKNFPSCKIPSDTTYLIESNSFTRPNDDLFWRGLMHHGRVPEDAITGRFSPEGRP